MPTWSSTAPRWRMTRRPLSGAENLLNYSRRENMTDKQIEALHKALLAIDEEGRDYAARFVKANAYKSPEELLEHWNQDQADREKAEDIQRHRREKLMDQVG